VDVLYKLDDVPQLIRHLRRCKPARAQARAERRLSFIWSALSWRG